jgi:hypothetical protein
MSAPILTGFSNTNIDETLTLSFVNLRTKIIDNVYSQNMMLEYLKPRATKKSGPAFSHGLRYGKNATAQRYSRYQMLSTTPQDNLTRDRWDMRQYAVTITIDGYTERIANAGDSKLADAVSEKRADAEEALALLLEQDMFAATSAADGFNSIPEIVTNSGTVGNINGTTSTWWQASVKSNSAGWMASGRKDLANLLNTLKVRNPAGYPNVIVSDQTTQELWEDSLTAQERYNTTAPANVGNKEVPTFKMIPWIWSTQATANTVFCLHDAAFEFTVDANTDFYVTPFTKPANQDARTGQILLAAAISTGNRRKLGKMTVGS